MRPTAPRPAARPLHGTVRSLAATLGVVLTAGLTVSTSTAPAAAVPTPFAPQIVEVDTSAVGEQEILRSLGLDLTESGGADAVQVVLHTPDDLARLVGSGLDYEVTVADLVRRQYEVNQADAAYAASTTRSALPSGRTSYRTLADYETDMTALAQAYPRLVSKFTLPHRSLDGRPVTALEIGSDVTAVTSGRPVFLMMGLHHAREWPTGDLTLEFAIDLARSYGRDPRITRLLDSTRVIVVPVVNPDGFHLSRTAGDLVDLRFLNEYDPLGGSASILATPGLAYMRKNCRLVDGVDTPDGTCFAQLTSPGGFGVGVDLNRNYGALWGGPGAAGGVPSPTAERVAGPLDPTYRGAAPFSEPETQNVRWLVSSRHVTTLVSNHTFGDLILRPNGVAPTTIGPDGLPVGDAPDEAVLAALGARMAAANGYANQHGWELYDTSGTTEDWSYNATGGLGYTFEIGDEFHPPFADVVEEYTGSGATAGKGNREAFLIAAESAYAPALTSTISGTAPAGAVLRITKTFETATWEGSTTDSLNSLIRVGRDGRFRWVVNPSTRPEVQPRTYDEVAATPTTRQAFTGTATPLAAVDHPFRISTTAPVWRGTLATDAPDDLDLEVLRRTATGLERVGVSADALTGTEQVEIRDLPAGDYVLRVTNVLGLSAAYSASSETFAVTTRTTAGTRESYTLSCELGGRVMYRQQVLVERGQTLTLPRSACRRR